MVYRRGIDQDKGVRRYADSDNPDRGIGDIGCVLDLCLHRDGKGEQEMRAISDEAVKALVNSGICTDTDADREYVCECIDNIPTIEPKRGKWIDEADKYDASFGIHDYRCSNCNSYADEYIGGHEWYTMYKPNYCPNCGADMRGREGE